MWAMLPSQHVHFPMLAASQKEGLRATAFKGLGP